MRNIFKKKQSEMTVGEQLIVAIVYMLLILPMSVIFTIISMVVTYKLEFMDWDDVLDAVLKWFKKIGERIKELFTKN